MNSSGDDFMGTRRTRDVVGRARRRPATPCRARRSSGAPCRNYAVRGGLVCRNHGGGAPQVRKAAERRWVVAQIERKVAVDVRRVMARQAAHAGARRARVASVLGLAIDDPVLGPMPGVNGWAAAAAGVLTAPISRSLPLKRVRWRAQRKGEAHAFASRQSRPICGGLGWDERYDWPIGDQPRHPRCAELAATKSAEPVLLPGSVQGRVDGFDTHPPSRPQNVQERGIGAGRHSTPTATGNDYSGRQAAPRGDER